MRDITACIATGRFLGQHYALNSPYSNSRMLTTSPHENAGDGPTLGRLFVSTVSVGWRYAGLDCETICNFNGPWCPRVVLLGVHPAVQNLICAPPALAVAGERQVSDPFRHSRRSPLMLGTFTLTSIRIKIYSPLL